MKKIKLFLIVTTLLLSFTFFYSLRVYQSHGVMSFLMYDFNNYKYNVPYVVYANFNDVAPNLTSTALPLKMLKARYFMNVDSLDIAKKLLFSSIKDNQYIKAPNQMLAQIYLKEKKHDSALIFSKDAFMKMPNVNPHRATYFEVLRHFKDSVGLDEAFELIKNSKNTSDWYDYLYSKNKINPNDKENIYKTIDDFKIKFPDIELTVINQIINIVELGSEGYALFEIYANAADVLFADEQYEESAKTYEKAILLSPNRYLLFENAAIAYDLSNQTANALEYYDKVIDDFKTKDGRVEFYKGLMLIKNRDMKGCDYLKISSDKNYIGKETEISAANVYLGLCLNNANN